MYILLELCRQRSLAELHRWDTPYTYITLLKYLTVECAPHNGVTFFYFSRRKALTEPETRYFVKQILEGMLYLHELGVIHRDLKLGNLLLSDELEVKICDFGLAASIEYEGQRRTYKFILMIVRVCVCTHM